MNAALFLILALTVVFAVIVVTLVFQVDRLTNPDRKTKTIPEPEPGVRRLFELLNAQVISMTKKPGLMLIDVLPTSARFSWVGFDGVVLSSNDIEPDVFTLHVKTGGRIGSKASRLFEDWTANGQPLSLTWDLDDRDQGPVRVVGEDKSVTLG